MILNFTFAIPYLPELISHQSPLSLITTLAFLSLLESTEFVLTSRSVLCAFFQSGMVFLQIIT